MELSFISLVWTSMRPLRCLSFLLMMTALARGAEVSVDVSSNESFVGLPVTMQVTINNAASHNEPEIADVDGLTIESFGAPKQSFQTSIVNGRLRSRASAVIYQFRVTPQREGSFTIPPIKVTADGVASITKAVRLLVTKSETGDLMFVEISGTKDKVFVGQAIDLSLKIWVRRYRDPEQGISLDEPQMWQQFSPASEWGKFADRINDLAKKNRRPGGQPVMREDADGIEHEYLLYEITTTVYPTHAGPIDGGDVSIVMNYPTKVGRPRDSFSSLFEDRGFPFSNPMIDDDFFGSLGNRVVPTAVRPIVASATLQDIYVVPIPLDGRPDDYMGAVGRYSISAEATPDAVKVGEPINLQLAINGTGPMELVSAPNLSSQQQLTKNFKVADDQLAGLVDGSRKTFRTTIRPQNESTTEIPPISFSFFDPDAEKFVTVKTNPISIKVDPSDLLSLDAIVADRPAAVRPLRSAQVSDDKADKLLNFSIEPTFHGSVFPADELLVDRPNANPLNGALTAFLLTPPIAFATFVLIAYRRRLAFFASSKRRLDRELSAATTVNDVAEALRVWLVSNLRVTKEQSSYDQLVGRLRLDGEREIAIRAERLFAKSAQAKTDFSVSPSVNEIDVIKSEARGIAESLRSKRPTIVRGAARSKATASLLLAICCTLTSNATAADFKLSADQQMEMLVEAIRTYESAMIDPTAPESKSKFESSAKAFQAVVDSGVRSDRLFFNLGNAHYQAGDRGRAIAAYRAALRISPTMSTYFDNLSIAESRDGSTPLVRRINEAVLRIIQPESMRNLAITTWIVFWALLCAYVRGRQTGKNSHTVRLLAMFSLAACVLSMTSYFFRVEPLTRDSLAVLVGQKLVVREGDGDEFSVVAEIESGDGELISVEDRRGGWVQIRRRDGTRGWLPDDRVVLL